MAVNTLADMQANIIDWVARTDLTTAVVNNFIDLAESEIVNGVYGVDGKVIVPPLRVKSMEIRDDTFVLDGEFTELPTGFLGFKSLKKVGDPDTVLDFVTEEVFNATWLSTGSTTTPRAYTIIGNEIRVGPGAAAADVLDVVYYKQPDNLVGVGSNWICTRYPNTYLYGALRHLAVYCGMDGRLSFFQSAFIGTLMSLHAAEKSTAFSGQLVMRTLGVTHT